MLFIDNVPS